MYVSFDCCSMVIACIKAMCSTLSFFKKSPSRYDVTEIFLSKERVYRIGASNKHAAIACFDAFTGDCEWNICMIP